MPVVRVLRPVIRGRAGLVPALLLAGAAVAQTAVPPPPPRLQGLAPAATAPAPAGAASSAAVVTPAGLSPSERPCAALDTAAETPSRRPSPATAVPAPPVRIVERLDGAGDGGPASAVECRVTVEADGTRIEELRVGGTTRRVVVHPKDGNRPYEIQLLDAGRDAAAKSGPGRGGAGQRVWPVLSF